jgi:DNA-binding IclR family transcriptional regulator
MLRPRMTRRKTQQGVQSIEVGGRLLQALATARQPMMLRDLAAAAGMPPAKAHRYLVSFGRMGLVAQEAVSGRYDLGPFALELGLAGLARLEPLKAAEPMLAELGETIGHTVALAVWGNQGGTIVRWLGSDTPISASLRTGSVMPLTRSATGRAFLAYLPRETTAKRVREELAANARAGLEPVTADEVGRIIDQTRRHGLARAVGDLIPGISGVAAPAFDYNGTMVLAVVALGYGGGFDAGWESEIATAVRSAAARISARLGFRPAA